MYTVVIKSTDLNEHSKARLVTLLIGLMQQVSMNATRSSFGAAEWLPRFGAPANAGLYRKARARFAHALRSRRG